MVARLRGSQMCVSERASKTRYNEHSRSVCHPSSPPCRGAFYAIGSKNVPCYGARNGLLLGQKAGDQQIRTQDVRDAWIPARISRDLLHYLCGENCIFTGTDLQQAMTDIGQALRIGERGKGHTRRQALLER